MKKIVTLLFVYFSLSHAQPNAFCCVPIADLLSTTMHNTKKLKSPITSYQNMPHYDIGYVCPRACQLLFNEQVEIIEERKDEVKIRVSHLYHKTNNNNKKHTYYWTQKKNLLKFSKISKETLSKLPSTPCFTKKTVDYNNVITLAQPFRDTKTNMHFSAGTRFVRSKKQKRTGYICVERFNPRTQQSEPLLISEKLCEWGLPSSASGKRRAFVSLLRSWAHPVGGSIPYVFGGNSIQTFCKSEDYTCKQFVLNGKKKKFYHRESKTPCAGIDCSHLVLRAAHMTGIPYFLKNTTTIIKELEPLKKTDTLENGDLLIWKGHVAIISDTEKGLLIEARAYNHGYGVVHEIPLSEQFKDIKTVTQLKDAYFRKKHITRLGKTRKKVGTIYDLQIMKFPIS